MPVIKGISKIWDFKTEEEVHEWLQSDDTDTLTRGKFMANISMLTYRDSFTTCERCVACGMRLTSVRDIVQHIFHKHPKQFQRIIDAIR